MNRLPVLNHNSFLFQSIVPQAMEPMRLVTGVWSAGNGGTATEGHLSVNVSRLTKILCSSTDRAKSLRQNVFNVQDGTVQPRKGHLSVKVSLLTQY